MTPLCLPNIHTDTTVNIFLYQKKGKKVIEKKSKTNVIMLWSARIARIIFPLREGVKKKRSFPNVGGWGGWFPNKVRTPQNPPKSPRKSPFSTQISPFVFPNLTKTQKKRVFVLCLPLVCRKRVMEGPKKTFLLESFPKIWAKCVKPTYPPWGFCEI